MSYPLVSIIIPTYNYANYIIEAIESILHQSYPLEQIEIIVVDDGSTDNTKDALNKLIESNTIKYFYQENKGKASATYKAIQHASGKYIFNLDADDYFLPAKIKKTVEIFESDDSVIHVASPAKQILDNGSYRIEPIPKDMLEIILNGNLLLKRFINENMLYGGGSTYAARAPVLKKIEIPDAVDMYIDEFLVLAILPFGNSFFIDEHLSVWRGHGFNYSLSQQNEFLQMSKAKRLLSSSDAILSYLIKRDYPANIINTYQLKNLTRKLAYKESLHKKTIKDISNYFIYVFLSIRPGWKVIKSYHVLNRLLPTTVFNFLKKKFSKSANKFLPR